MLLLHFQLLYVSSMLLPNNARQHLYFEVVSFHDIPRNNRFDV